ncbi:two-partner secretion domain-containing protein, partial [Microcoleus sp. N9_A1]|uniref:two-partner secretion domain-containing protein n=1 Tax=Microcoleus sp. N9_A1 TaxID=3055380 RepID=UPI002FD3DDE5
MTTNRLHLLGWLFIVGWLSAAAAPANAQPIAPAADGTNTVVTPNGNRYDISGGSFSGDKANLFHSFTQFGLSEGQTANFLTNPNIQNILGRITGGNPSLINGLIQVTGGNSNLFLMNPAGLIFGPNASLNVPGSFNASTATGIGFGNNQWFSAIGNNNWATLIGTPNSFAFTNLPGGSIINAGNLTVTPGKSLSLIGGTVVNTGQVTAPSGNILISAVPGNNLVRISQAGNLLSLDIQPTANQTSLPNNWTQPVLSLPELLTGQGVAQATGLTVNPNGELVLTGNVAVPVTAGTAIASGTLNVSGNTGGTVNILGDKVGVIAGNIDASGINGGGNVLIGGDYQGLGTVPNALRTFISNNSTINVDGVSNGNGGRVIVWADDVTRFYGNISARGGVFSGNGGFVEVSGYNVLDFQGNVNTLAPNGTPGLLLLDPTDITIITVPGSFTALTQVDQFADPDNAPNTIDVNLINVSATNVALQATGNITFNAPVGIITPGVGLTAKANNDIIVNQNIITNGGSITLNADADNSNIGGIIIDNATSVTINTNGGDFSAIANGQAGGGGIAIRNTTLNVGNGNINLNGTADIGNGISIDNSLLTSVQGNINFTGNGTFVSGTGVQINGSTVSSAQGNISIIGTTVITPNNGISLSSGSLISTNGGGSINLISPNGNINTSAGNISTNFTGGGGAIAISTTGGGDITTGNLSSFSTGVAAGGNITLSVTGGTGYIDTIAGILRANSTFGNGGAIALSTTGGNITTKTLASFSLGAGTGGDITLAVTGGTGAIDTTAGTNLDSQSNSGNGGAISLSTAGGNITTNKLISFSLGAGTGGDITLSVTGGTGSIDTTANFLQSSSTTGNGGAIALSTAGGNITTGNLGSNPIGAGTGGDITLSVTGGTGAIDISAGFLDSSSKVGNGGAITLSTAGGNISAGNVKSYSSAPVGNGGNITFSVTGGTGAINTTAGLVDATSTSGNGGAIAISTANGNITNGDLITGSSGVGNGGNITLSVTGVTGAINTTAGLVDATSSSGNGGAIAFLTGGGNITSGATNSFSSGTGTGGNITLSVTGGTGAINTTGGNVYSSSISGNGGPIALTAPGGITTGFLESNTTSTSSSSTAGLITFNPGTNNTTISGDIDASATAGSGGNITFPSPVILTQSTITLTTSGTTSSGNLTFNSTLNGTTANTESLLINAGAGNVTFTGAIGSITPLQNINANSTATTTFNAVNAASVTTNTGGTTQLNSNVTTTGAQTYNDAVTIANNPILTGNGITFNSTLDGNSDITANAGASNLTFTGPVGGTTALGNINANSTATTTFNAVNAASVTTNAGGTTELKGNVATIGSQTYGDAVTIATNPI